MAVPRRTDLRDMPVAPEGKGCRRGTVAKPAEPVNTGRRRRRRGQRGEGGGRGRGVLRICSSSSPPLRGGPSTAERRATLAAPPVRNKKARPGSARGRRRSGHADFLLDLGVPVVEPAGLHLV